MFDTKFDQISKLANIEKSRAPNDKDGSVGEAPGAIQELLRSSVEALWQFSARSFPEEAPKDFQNTP